MLFIYLSLSHLIKRYISLDIQKLTEYLEARTEVELS